MEPSRVVAIVAAAGSGERIGADEPKAFLMIGGRPIVSVAVEEVASCPSIGAVIVVAPAGFEDRMRGALAEIAPDAVVVPGGATRQASVRAGLAVAPSEAEVIVVHDAARPFASRDIFESVVSAVDEGADAAIPVLRLTDTVKRVRDGIALATEPREDLALAQTPQAFRASLLRSAHERAHEEGLEVTDDAALLERSGAKVVVVPGDPANFKITTPVELLRADELLGAPGG